MSFVVVWTPKAIEDIRRLYSFLAEKNSEAAKAAAALLLKQTELLEMFPYAGRPAEDLEPEHREIVIPFGVAGYVLLYRFDEEGATVTILAVRHQKEVGY